MAVTKVEASIAEEKKELLPMGGDRYSGNMTAPLQSGQYSVEICAHDDAGNIAVANAETNKNLFLDVTKWKSPKTNWTVNDRFNFVDYNRIKNNLQWLYESASELNGYFEIEDMGEDISDYASAWKAKYFNTWEQNLETINNHMLVKDYGASQHFFENGQFIQWDELNRIESATLSMRGILEGQIRAMRRLPFRLGNFKEVKT